MSNYYIGGIGKDQDWQLISEQPFVVYQEGVGEFTAFSTLEETIPFLDRADRTVYAFNPWRGGWEIVNFAAVTSGPQKAMGFNPG